VFARTKGKRTVATFFSDFRGLTFFFRFPSSFPLADNRQLHIPVVFLCLPCENKLPFDSFRVLDILTHEERRRPLVVLLTSRKARVVHFPMNYVYCTFEEKKSLLTTIFPLLGDCAVEECRLLR